MKHFVVGVSGKIGSGKTTFCHMCEKFGAFHINADEIVHEMYESGKDGTKLVEKIFGDKYLDKDGSVSRRRLRKHFIDSTDDFKMFLKIFYPILANKVKGMIEASKSRIILFEFIDFDMDIFSNMINLSVEIECSEKLIFKRYSKKFPVNYLKKVLFLQKGIKRPDLVIKNNSTKSDLRTLARNFIMSL